MQTETRPMMTQSADLSSIAALKDAWLRAEPIEFGDPVLAHVALPFHKTYFPLGFPVSIETNSQLVLEAADQSWKSFTSTFGRKPIRLQICVSPSESFICPPAPVCRMRNHLVTNVADGENFTVCDLDKGTASVWVTDTALKSLDYFRYFFLESAAMAHIAGKYATGVHAACVALDGVGVLLCGDSGAGKSTLAYACARAGWNYITDDGSYLIHGRTDRLVVGNCTQVRFRPHAQNLFPELHGLPIMQRAGVGKPSLELNTHARTALLPVPTVNVRHIVFLNRHDGTEHLAPFPRAVARLYMLQRIHCLPYQVEQHLTTIERLLEIEPHELHYTNLDWAVEQLSLLVRQGS